MLVLLYGSVFLRVYNWERTTYTEQTGFLFFRSFTANSERKLVVRSALSPMRVNHTFRCRLVNIGLINNSKQVKVVFCSPEHSRGHHIFIRSTKNSGGRGNPFSPIDVNTFCTTNFRSRSAMRGAEFHGNTRRDGQPA